MPRRNSPSPKDGRLNFLGPRLRELRKKAGLLQADVVARLQRKNWDINEPVYSTIENGKRQISDWEVKLLLDALGARWRDLE